MQVKARCVRPDLWPASPERSPWGSGTTDTRARGLWAAGTAPKVSPGPKQQRHLFQEARPHLIRPSTQSEDTVSG